MESHVYLVGEFKILDVERKGGMSRVRKASLLASGEACALKYSNRESSEDAASTSFKREAGALSDMEHKSIVRLLGIGSDGAERFLVLEWLEETLQDKLESLC